MSCDMAKSPGVLRLRRTLHHADEAPILPRGVRFCAFDPSQASCAHALLELAYAPGEGSIGEFADWWSSLSSDTEFDESLCFLACDANSCLIGVAQCWTSAFVKDLAVHPLWRRRGLGRALLLRTFAAFKQRGARAVDLKVQSDNVAARALYLSVGMRPV
jgi:ribosomal protein S18 acetylase RimI-like enzyme